MPLILPPERFYTTKTHERHRPEASSGPHLAYTALVAEVGDWKVFSSVRSLAAWIGLVPKQHSTGGKERLGGISKQGNRYLRWLLSRRRASPTSLAVGRCDRVQQRRIHPVGAKDFDGDHHWQSAELHGVYQIKLNCEAA